MPITSFADYAREVEKTLHSAIAAGEAVSVSVQVDQHSSLRGSVGGTLQFNDGSQLHFREFLDVSLPEPRLAYAYHHQSSDQRLVFRYDDAAHGPALASSTHKRLPTGAEPSPAPSLAQVLSEVVARFRP